MNLFKRNQVELSLIERIEFWWRARVIIERCDETQFDLAGWILIIIFLICLILGQFTEIPGLDGQ